MKDRAFAPPVRSTARPKRRKPSVASPSLRAVPEGPLGASEHRFGQADPLPATVAPEPDLRTHAILGRALDGKAEFLGDPSPLLVAHERIHLFQQELSRRGTPSSSREELEAEARDLAPRLSRGETVEVVRSAPAGMALYGSDPDKTYTSTNGLVPNDPYIQAAFEFHDKWGYKPIKVESLEEVVQDLSAGSGKLKAIRIVTHASKEQLFMKFMRGGEVGVSEEELRSTNQTETVASAIDDTQDFTDDASKTWYRDAVEQADAALAKRLGISKAKIDDRSMDEYFLWLLNRERGLKVPGVPAAVQTALKAPLDAKVLARRKLLDKSKFVDADLDALEKKVSGLAYSWRTPGAGDVLTQISSRVSSTQDAYGTRDFAKKWTQAKARFDKDSTVEIRGCKVGATQSYMEAVQLYFGSTTGAPGVNAPDWYQYFGHVAIYEVDDDEDQIRLHWNKWPHRQDLKASFAKWAPVFSPGTKLPASPGWTDLRDYLRAGHAVPMREGGLLFVFKGKGEPQIVDWISKQDQRIVSQAGILKQLGTGNVRDLVTTGFVVQWIQDAYDTPTAKKIFSYDPAWAGHFKSVAGN